MPRIVPNGQVAHLWAHQAQSDARSGNGNFWFDGDTLYSYSTPIARIVEAHDGRRVALVTIHSYSTTTNGKHIGAIGRATNYGRFIPEFRVPSLGAFGGRHTDDRHGIVDHERNLAHFATAYRAEHARQSRKRDFDHIQCLADLNRIANAAADYAEAFGHTPLPLDTDADAQALSDAYAAKQTPAAIAKRERAATVRAAAKAAREAREHAARVEREAAWHADFRAGGRYYPVGLRDEHGGALLRAVDETLETSLGARVPLAHAIKAFQFVKLCRERNKPFYRNGRVVRVGHFTVDQIHPSGDFHAGCHFITWAECERLALELGVFDAPASAEAVETA
jgi:hypothetical protein